MLGSRNYDPVTKTWSGYAWQSYRQVDQRVNAFGSGVMHINESVLGNSQLNRWSLGIWSLNRPEWFISEMICNYYNLVSVPLYETLGPDAVEYVMNHAEIKVAVVSGTHLFICFNHFISFFCHSHSAYPASGIH
jgi:long-chain acyl-CoA synthetase